MRKETSVLRSVFEKINAKLISGSDTTYFDEQIETGKSYAYQIVAMDEGGNKSTPSKPLSIHYLNSEKPKLPNNVRIVFEKEKKQNKITWEVLKQPPTFAGYMVFRKEVGRNYSPVSRIISATEFVDTRLMEEVKYYYKIKVCLTDGTLVENEKEFNP